MGVPPVLLRGLTPLWRQEEGRKSLAVRWSFIVGWVSADTHAASGWPWYARWHAIFRFEVFLSAAIGLLVGLGWAATGFGYFWPGWVWLALAVPVALQAAVRWGLRAPPGRRFLSVHASVSFALGVLLLAIWLLSGFGYFGRRGRSWAWRSCSACTPISCDTARTRGNRRWPTGWTC